MRERSRSEDATPAGGRPAILRLAAPLVLSFWFRAAFQWVDAAFAASLPGAGVGDASLAAIGLALPFEFAMIACWVGTSNGLTSRLAAALGAREGAKIHQLERAALRIVLALTAMFLLLAAGIWLLTPHLSLEPLVRRQFRLYGTILVGGSAFTTFWSVLPDSTVKAHHDTKSTMWAGIASTLLNVSLNTLFVFGLGLGIGGIALATVLGRLGGLTYALRQARRHERARLARGGDDRPGTFARPVRAILALALPAGASYLLLAGEGLWLNALVASSGEPRAALAAWAVYDRAARFLSMPVIATAVALLPLAARLAGAGRLEAVRRELSVAALATLAFSLLLLPLVLLCGPLLVDALVDARAARADARRLLLLVPAAVAFGGPAFLLRSLLEGLQRPRPGLVFSALRSALLVVPLATAGPALAARFALPAVLGVALGQLVGVALATGGFFFWARRRVLVPRSVRIESNGGAGEPQPFGQRRA